MVDYLFFPKETRCIPIFELMQVQRHWGNSCINKMALENVIWYHYPEYAAVYDAQETAGQHSLIGQVINYMGGEIELTSLDEQMIALHPETSTDFCTLLD